MIYFDTAYIAKCYLNEPGADRVREVAYAADGLASCELARVEFAAILRRHVRERHVSRREMTAILKDFEENEQNGVWQWFGVTSDLLERTRRAVLDMPVTVSSDPVTPSIWRAPKSMGFGRSTRATATC
jgi:predicted nucleic acid-binding protein